MIRLSIVKPFRLSRFIFIFDACNMLLKRDVFAARSGEMLCSFMFFHLSLKNISKWEDWRLSGDGSMWTAIGYGEVDAFIIIVLFSGQGPDLTPKGWASSILDALVRISWILRGRMEWCWFFRWSCVSSQNYLWISYDPGFTCSRSFYDGGDECACCANIEKGLTRWRWGCFADLALWSST